MSSTLESQGFACEVSDPDRECVDALESISSWFVSTFGIPIHFYDSVAGTLSMGEFSISVTDVAYLYAHRDEGWLVDTFKSWVDYCGWQRVVGVTDTISLRVYHAHPTLRKDHTWFTEAMRLRKVAEDAQKDWQEFIAN